jgi:4-hydroxythreonine-4-phosphate dehydrogenase
MKPVIGLTCGDPAGIGPEVIRGALVSGRLPEGFGYRVLGETDRFQPGHPTRESARHAFETLEEAVRQAKRGEIQAVVTGPISKKSMYEVGFRFPGQTEFFADRTGTQNFAMCLTGGALTVALTTVHVPLKDVPALLSRKEIVRVGGLLVEFLRRRKWECPRVAVAGLNPHAGEEGEMGREEIEIIGPAVTELQALWKSRARISGPYPPDTLFHRAAGGEFDGVLCMYHDQGLIPLKLHAFDEGVNVTLGLPYPRTSPDHGTAFEIAGKNLARPDSMIAAIRLACEMV